GEAQRSAARRGTGQARRSGRSTPEKAKEQVAYNSAPPCRREKSAPAYRVNQIAQLLSEANILLDLEATSKKRLFEQVGQLFEDHAQIARSVVFDSLFAREKLGSTGLGQGIAMRQVSIEKLFVENQQRLGLNWLAGRQGGNRVLIGEAALKPTIGQVGHMNFIHPFRVQLIGAAEAAYLRGLPEDALTKSIGRLFTTELAAIIVANGEDVPAHLLDEC